MAARPLTEQTCGVSYYEDQVVPRLIDVMLGTKAVGQLRKQVAAGLSGEVLEVGFGSGLNVPYYPPAVTRVQAVDPAMVGRKLAAKRIAASRVPVEFVGLDGQHLPVESGSIDHVLITWTMCTIPDIETALAEMRRVLRPGGQMHFIEHGLAPDPKVVRWQHRLNPIENRVAGGCNLNRPIDTLIENAGFSFDQLETFYGKGPKSFSYFYEGVATPA
jgi:ubiquinone/menaquinone biosynthesis C-methylase UbiE